MADTKGMLAKILAAKGDLAIKRMSLKVGFDLNKILSGATVADALLESKITNAAKELGF